MDEMDAMDNAKLPNLQPSNSPTFHYAILWGVLDLEVYL